MQGKQEKKQEKILGPNIHLATNFCLMTLTLFEHKAQQIIHCIERTGMSERLLFSTMGYCGSSVSFFTFTEDSAFENILPGTVQIFHGIAL